MSVQSQITRLSQNVSNSLTAIAAKGVTVPSGSTSDNLATLIGQIETRPAAYAYVRVSFPSGSTCKATSGSKTITSPVKTGTYVFEIPTPSSTPESWTFTCTKGSDSSSKSLSVTAKYQVDQIRLSYSRLPSGYQEVEYVKCVRIISPSSYSYFRTGYNLSGSTMANTEIDFAYMLNAPNGNPTSGSGQYAYIFGTTQYGLTAHSSQTDGTLDYKFAGNVVGNVPIEVDVKHTIKYNENSTRKIIDNGTTIATCGTPSTSTSNPMILGSVLSGTSTSSSPFSIRLYEYIVKVSGTIVYDLVPCVNPSNEVGFYDIIGGSFLSKSGGTVEAGPDV